MAVVGSDAYKWLLAFHILLAVVWVGSNTAIQIFVIRGTRASGDRLAYLASEIEWYGTRVLLPTSLTLVVLGFILLHESSGAYDLGQGWVAFGFAAWLFSAIVGGRAILARSLDDSANSSRNAAPMTPEYQSRFPPSLPRLTGRTDPPDPGRCSTSSSPASS